jgi:FKBP-type peptidyl-prolyl cis-trans isomerase
VRRLGTALVIILVAVVVPVTAAPAASDPLTKITIDGAAGTKPTVRFTAPFKTKTSIHRVIAHGQGASLTKGTKVTLDYVLVDGRTGTEIGTSFGKAPQSFLLDDKQVPAAMVKGLTGLPVGSRLLLAMAPKDGFARGLTDAGVKKSDTLLFVFDVKAARTPLTRAAGTPVAPVAGLPTVKLDPKGKPTITVPKTTAPTQLVVQPLVKGAGAVVVSGQSLTVHYTGVIWASGKKFDSSWDRGAPFDPVPIGTGAVVVGWDQGLVGQTVGSQVLLVIPPALGYGTSGNSNAGISGTDTLVFVVDILDAS